MDTTLNLSAMTKPTLVAMTKVLEGQAGDYARLPKEHYLAVLSKYDEATLRRALPDNPAYVTPAPAPVRAAPPASLAQPAAPRPAPAVQIAPAVVTPAPTEDAAAKLAEAMRAFLPAQQHVSREEFAALFDEQFAARGAELIQTVEQALKLAVDNMPTRIERIVVDPQKVERKVEGHVHKAFERVLKLAGIRQNILLVGPAGCGKTNLAHQVAQALGLPFSMNSLSSGMSENQLTGWLLPVEAGGKFRYVPASFVTAYENGGVHLLDEIDAGDENTLLVINAALANGQMHVPQRHENPIIKRHPDFVCIAAANTFGHGADMIYAGRNKLDGATLDRFRAGMVKMDYDAQLEQAISNPEVLAWALQIRDGIANSRLRRVMSTRAILDFSKQADALGFTKADWEESYFADWSRDELAKVGR